jgi:hypothetical protein
MFSSMATASDTARTTDRAKTASTPWGAASIVEEVTLAQRAGELRFASVVQLLETASGERLVRFAYTTGGTARRGPVTLRERDLERLRAALDRHPSLKVALMA